MNKLLVQQCSKCNIRYSSVQYRHFGWFSSNNDKGNNNSNNSNQQSNSINNTSYDNKQQPIQYSKDTAKQLKRQEIRYGFGELKGELSYYKSLISSKDKHKHETQSSLVRPLPKNMAKRLNKIKIKLLNNDNITIPNDIIKQDSIYSDKITVLLLCSNEYSTQILHEWKDMYNEFYNKQATHQQHTDLYNSVQFMTIHIIDRWFTRVLLGKSVFNNLRKLTTNEDDYSHIGVTLDESPDTFTQQLLHLRELLYGAQYSVPESAGYMQLRGRMFGNVIIIDNNGLVRWMTIGKPADKEQSKYFIDIVTQLVQSMKLAKQIENRDKVKR